MPAVNKSNAYIYRNITTEKHLIALTVSTPAHKSLSEREGVDNDGARGTSGAFGLCFMSTINRM